MNQRSYSLMDDKCSLGDHPLNCCYVGDIVRYIVSQFSKEVCMSLLPSNVNNKLLQCGFLKV